MTDDLDLEQRLRAVLTADAERLIVRAATGGRAQDDDDVASGPASVRLVPTVERCRRRAPRLALVAASALVVAAAAGIVAARTPHSVGTGGPAGTTSGRASLQSTTAPRSTPSRASGEEQFQTCATPAGVDLGAAPEAVNDTYGKVQVLDSGGTSRYHWRSFYRVGRTYLFFGICQWGLTDATGGTTYTMVFHKLADVPGRSSARTEWTTQEVDPLQAQHKRYFISPVPDGAATIDVRNAQGVSLGRLGVTGSIVSPGTRLAGGAIVPNAVATIICYDRSGHEIARLRG